MIIVVHDVPRGDTAIEESLSLVGHRGPVKVLSKPEQAFGEVIRAVRASLGMTLAQVGEATGLSVTYLSDVERGNRGVTMPTARELARLFDKPELLDLALGAKLWDLVQEA